MHNIFQYIMLVWFHPYSILSSFYHSAAIFRPAATAAVTHIELTSNDEGAHKSDYSLCIATSKDFGNKLAFLFEDGWHTKSIKGLYSGNLNFSHSPVHPQVPDYAR